MILAGPFRLGMSHGSLPRLQLQDAGFRRCQPSRGAGSTARCEYGSPVPGPVPRRRLSPAGCSPACFSGSAPRAAPAAALGSGRPRFAPAAARSPLGPVPAPGSSPPGRAAQCGRKEGRGPGGSGSRRSAAPGGAAGRAHGERGGTAGRPGARGAPAGWAVRAGLSPPGRPCGLCLRRGRDRPGRAVRAAPRARSWRRGRPRSAGRDPENALCARPSPGTETGLLSRLSVVCCGGF